MPIAPGTRIGGYVIVGPLGSGGMGEVYQAHDPTLQRTVAIKVLAKQDADASARLLQEARAASALNHPHICTIHEINENPDGQLYLVMAYYEGETLKQRIAGGPLAIDDAIDGGTQVRQGLVKTHSAGIVHRDIKPANLMVTADGTHQHKYEKAAIVLRKAQPSPPGCHWSVGLLGHCYGRWGKTEDAQRLLSRLQELSETTYIPALSFAW